VASGFENLNIWCESQVLASKCNAKLLSNYKFCELKSIKVNYTKKYMLLQHPTTKFNIQVIPMVGIGRRKRQSRMAGQRGGRPKMHVDSVLQDEALSQNCEVTIEQEILSGMFQSQWFLLSLLVKRETNLVITTINSRACEPEYYREWKENSVPANNLEKEEESRIAGQSK